jgi:Sec-independent protein translocase protein TatA
MELFNVGILEFLFIILLAFIVLGPKKAVKTAGDVGRWIHDLLESPIWQEIKNTSRDIRDIPRKITDDAEIQRTLESIDYSIGRKNDALTEAESTQQVHGSEDYEETDNP